MPEIKQIGAQLKNFWLSRTRKERLFLGAGAAASVGLVALFATLVARPDYKPLIGGLETADAQTITADLKAKNIPFQLTPDGKSISVPADQLDAARLEVASNQSTHSGRLGFEIFDKVSWGQTEFDEKVNYQRALEGELERTITTLAGVKSVRVHLVMPTDSVFIDRERSAKASVTLKVSKGGLTREETQSIQRLVSGAVEGLKPADVSIIDADSNEPMNVPGGSTSEDSLERQLAQKLTNTLGPVVGQDHLRASVNVEYDLSTSEENQEKYDPNVSVPLSMQRTEESNGSKSGAGGVPGTTSNVPKNKPNVPAPVSTADENAQSYKTETATYGVNKTTLHSLEPAGRIKRITAALLVDDVVTRGQGKDGQWISTRVKRSPQELQQIQSLAQDAIGLDTARGDVITVQNLAFAANADADMQAPNLVERVRKEASSYSTAIRYAMLLILFVLGYALMVRPIQKKVLSAEAMLPMQPTLPELAIATPLPIPDTNPLTNPRMLKEQLVQQMTAEPAKNARLLQAWLREGAE